MLVLAVQRGIGSQRVVKILTPLRQLKVQVQQLRKIAGQLDIAGADFGDAMRNIMMRSSLLYRVRF